MANSEGEKRPRGWNFRKGAKNAISAEEASKRGKTGGKTGGLAQVPKGFADPNLQAKAQLAKKLNEADNDTDNDSQ